MTRRIISINYARHKIARYVGIAYNTIYDEQQRTPIMCSMCFILDTMRVQLAQLHSKRVSVCTLSVFFETIRINI